MIIQEYGQCIPVSKYEATIAFLPYAARREEAGQGKPSDTSFRTARFSPSSSPISHWTPELGGQLLQVVLPSSLKHAVLHTFQQEPQFMKHASDIDTMMRLWITAVTTLPYTDDVGRIVANTLLQMAADDELLPHIPTVAWDWLKKRPLLRPGCWGLVPGSENGVILKVRKPGDVELTTSYLFVIWSEWRRSGWGSFRPSDCKAIFRAIREELSGVGAAGYRADLIQRLDHVLSQLEPGPMSEEKAIRQKYKEFREALVEVDEEATQILTGMSRTATAPFRLLTYIQDAILPSCVRFPFHAHDWVDYLYPLLRYFKECLILSIYPLTQQRQCTNSPKTVGC